MVNLLGARDLAFLFSQLFLQQLPSHVRAALASSKLSTISNYRALAAEADMIFLASQQQQYAAALLPAQAFPSQLGEAAHRRQQDTSLCFYHARSGMKAKQCHSPCSYSGAEMPGPALSSGPERWPGRQAAVHSGHHHPGNSSCATQARSGVSCPQQQ